MFGVHLQRRVRGVGGGGVALAAMLAGSGDETRAGRRCLTGW